MAEIKMQGLKSITVNSERVSWYSKAFDNKRDIHTQDIFLNLKKDQTTFLNNNILYHSVHPVIDISDPLENQVVELKLKDVVYDIEKLKEEKKFIIRFRNLAELYVRYPTGGEIEIKCLISVETGPLLKEINY